jgi:membrane-bound ClpP family serine protease
MSTSKDQNTKGFAFGPTNYKILLVGIVVILIGFLLMVGGGSEDPNVFNPEIFSFRRITLAPVVVLIGFAIEVIAILYKPKK